MGVQCLISRLVMASALLLLNVVVFAGGTLWTFTPLTTTTHVVPITGTATIQYKISNQSRKPRQLMMAPMAGISQVKPCVLMPHGTQGETCLLELVITGSALPATGISGGPRLCQVNPDGTPNAHMCYQPIPEHSLNLSVGKAEYMVGGTVLGLNGTLVLQNNGTNLTSIHSNGNFNFSTLVASGSSYAVTVQTQPAGQTCHIVNGTGTMGGANVSNVSVSCSTNYFTVGGSISGLAGTVVLQNNGLNLTPINADGNFIFSTSVAEGSNYAVTVQTQPAGQICTVVNGSGTMGSSNVSNVTVICSTNYFTVGGSISGLVGTVTLQNNGMDFTSINAAGSFVFPTPVAQGSGYAVTVQTQPAGYTCVVVNGTGTMGGANVSNVSVSCSQNHFTVGGTVSGLVGIVTLQNNGMDFTAINADGSFIFSTSVAEGASYAVTIQTQPANQTCTVVNGSGVMGGANISNVAVSCSTNYFTVGGSISGLVGTVTLLNNGANATSLNSDGSFTFSTPVAQGSNYAVTVQTQPAGYTCNVVNGTDTMGGANVSNVSVTCSQNYFSVGGSISGLVGTVTLLNNGANATSFNSDGSFTFSSFVAEGSNYAVTLQTQPAGQTCVVINGVGTMGGANVSNVSVSCSTNYFTVGGSISGLVGTVVLQNNSMNSTSINADGNFTFSTSVAEGSGYAVTVQTQPVGYTCVVANGTGVMGGANVSNVSVSCSQNYFTVGGTISGLVGSVTLQNNGTDTMVMGTDGNFTFTTSVAEGSNYAVTVQTQPVNQTCTIANGSGVMGGGNVSDVTVTCNINYYTVGGNISGLTGTVVLQNNGVNTTSVSANGSFTLSTPVAQGGSYAVTVQTQPLGQICSVANSSGTMGGANVVNVTVTCSTNYYTVSGNVTGLTGTVTFQNNGTNATVVSANGGFIFSTPVAEGSKYDVRVTTQPAGQICAVANGSATMGGANVTNVAVTCFVKVNTTLSAGTSGIIPVNNSSGTLTVTNTGTNSAAYNVRAQLPGGWTGVTQDTSNCTSIAPNGGTCTLSFTSTTPYVAQGGITITGDNITSPPTTVFAFTVSGYLVWAVDSGTSVSVVDSADLSVGMRWGNPITTGATSITDGFSNTGLINSISGIGVSAAVSCYNSTSGGASVGTWYLPAICQVAYSAGGAGCAPGQPNINTGLTQFGLGGLAGANFYWSSTEKDGNYAWYVYFGNGQFPTEPKGYNHFVRCARSLTY